MNKKENVYIERLTNGIFKENPAFVMMLGMCPTLAYLSPVTIHAGFRTFIRDRRLYLITRIIRKETGESLYVLIKVPHSKVSRFIALPPHKGMHYFMFIDDVIRYNLPSIFPGYELDGCYSIKISRDADIYVEEETSQTIVQAIRDRDRKSVV